MAFHTRPQKNKKTSAFRTTILAAAAAFIFSPAAHAAVVDIDNVPLAGVAASYAPNVALALSVEFPTAGAAYSQDSYLLSSGYNTEPYPHWMVMMALDARRSGRTVEHLATRYHGYFDNNKCYVYERDAAGNGYFRPSSMAQTNGGMVGLCNNGGAVNEFSGNYLNWATMSALDIFRKTMTGGNRAYSTANTATAYTQGDTNSKTFIRRANVVHDRNGALSYRLRIRGLRMDNQINTDILNRLMPVSVSETVLLDATLGIAPGQTGLPRAGGFKVIGNNLELTNELVPESASFADSSVFLMNNQFGTAIIRRVNGVTARYAYQDLSAINPSAASRNPTFNRYITGLQTARTRYAGQPHLDGAYMPVVVEVCNPTVGLEDNCVNYTNVAKPEGLLQQYARRGMRVATFGYLNVAGNNTVDGGVLRSRMKYLTNPTGVTIANPAWQSEWEEATGQIKLNPENAPDGNSGSINYLNKFGDFSGYKTNDPGSELYYTAMRYLRGMSFPYTSSHMTNAAARDGFPVNEGWGDDPLRSDFANDSKEPMCRPNTIIYIGDTNTHSDGNLPNFPVGEAQASPRINDDPVQTRTLLEEVLASEGRGGQRWDSNLGSGAVDRWGYSPAGMAALAYWARTNDTRSDIPGYQYHNNFIIDVLEGGGSKEHDGSSYGGNKGNTYYMAAKYGGFNNGFDINNVTREAPNRTITNRNQWTTDPDGASSDPYNFPRGVPNNFALGNNPDNLIAALTRALGSAGEYNEPSQAAPSFTTPPGTVIDLRGSRSTVILQSAYDFNKLTGDAIASTVTMGSNGQLVYTTLWKAGTILTNAYHHATNWNTRRVFTRNNSNGVIPFNTANAASFAQPVGSSPSASTDQVIEYVLGNNAGEGVTMREREGLLGTLVNPTISTVTSVTSDVVNRLNTHGCTYADLAHVQSRQNVYIVGANDGMVHVFDHNGNERMAYMLSTALPHLGEYSSPSYVHRYLNDGTPVLGEVCFGGQARSVVVGTAGRGGASVYAVDATDMRAPGAGNIMWEFSQADDADLGLTVSPASIARSNTGRPIAIVSSGYKVGVDNASARGYIYVLNIDKPQGDSWAGHYTKIELGNSGVGQVFVYDENQDGVPEKLYAGDYDGHLWRVDYAGGAWTASKLYDAPAGSAPITTAPAAERVNGRLYVVAGTGQYFNNTGIDPTLQNYAYGFFDDGNTIAGHGELLQQTIGDNVTSSTTFDADRQSAWTVSNNSLTPAHKGWYLQLQQGQTITNAASIYQSKVAQFQAVRQTDSANSCTISGSTSFINVDLTDGGLFDQPLFDTNNDGKFDGDDVKIGMVTFNNLIAPSSGMAPVQTDQGLYNTIVAIGVGDKINLNINPLLNRRSGLRRLSWREIY